MLQQFLEYLASDAATTTGPSLMKNSDGLFPKSPPL
jgi:hypothetical protein